MHPGAQQHRARPRRDRARDAQSGRRGARAPGRRVRRPSRRSRQRATGPGRDPARCRRRRPCAVLAAGAGRRSRRRAANLGLATHRLYSAAGHDAQNLARITDSGMIFIPSRGGAAIASTRRAIRHAIERGANVAAAHAAGARHARRRRRSGRRVALAEARSARYRPDVTTVRSLTARSARSSERSLSARCWAAARGTGRCPPSSPARTSRARSCPSTASSPGRRRSSASLVFVALGWILLRFRDRPGGGAAAPDARPRAARDRVDDRARARAADHRHPDHPGDLPHPGRRGAAPPRSTVTRARAGSGGGSSAIPRSTS